MSSHEFTPDRYFTGQTNRYAGNCACCLERVRPDEGYYDGNDVWCSTPGSVGDINRVCEDRTAWGIQQAIKLDEARERNMQPRERTAKQIEWDTKRAEQDRVWAAQGLRRCVRCSGEGGASSWPGFTCFDCGGSGTQVAS
jgi:DnaJ-class molecular chaperone